MSSTAMLLGQVRLFALIFCQTKYLVTAPNEISIRDFEVVQPMLGPGGFTKGMGKRYGSMHDHVF